VHSSPGVTVTRFSGAGDYNVQFPQAVTTWVPTATVGENSGNALPSAFISTRTEGTAAPLAANGVEVLTRISDTTTTRVDEPFNLTVTC
jgi:hypothetical protein